MIRQFTMTQTQYDKLMADCGPEETPRDSVHSAWTTLGKDMGFKPENVQVFDSKGPLYFTAEVEEKPEEGSHLIAGEFVSDKFPWSPIGFFPMKFTDKNAQPVLWQYAKVMDECDDSHCANDIRGALVAAGYEPPKE